MSITRREPYYLYAGQALWAASPPYSIQGTFATVLEGALLVVRAYISGGNPLTVGTVTVEDDKGNVYRPAQAPIVDAGHYQWAQDFYAWNCPAATNLTITVRLTSIDPAFITYFWMGAVELSGQVGGRDPLVDAAATAVDSLVDPFDFSMGTVTPSAAGDYILMMGNKAGFPWVLPPVIDVPPPGSAVTQQYSADYAFSRLAADASPYEATASTGESANLINTILVFKTDSSVWRDIPDVEIHPLDAAQYPGGLARVVCKLWTKEAGQWIKARLVSLLADGTIDAVVGTSAQITATAPTDASFPVTLTGIKDHKLQFTSPSDEDCGCAPDAEVRP
jgi:hypothetical protein